MMSFEEFKKLINSTGGEPEYYIYFNFTEIEYMIIKYKNYVTFQRCGENASGEFKYNTIDILYESDLIDGINLKRDWNKITDIVQNP